MNCCKVGLVVKYRRDDERNRSGEESYPPSPLTHDGGSGPIQGPDLTNGLEQRHAFPSEAAARAAAAAAMEAEEAAEAVQLSRQPTLTAPGSAQGFGSAHSSVARSVSVSDAEDVSLGASEDRGDLQEVSKLAADPAIAAGAQAASAAAGGQGADAAAGAATANGDAGPATVTPLTSEDSLAAEVAKARALMAGGMAGGLANGTASHAAGDQALQGGHAEPVTPARITKRVSATFLAAREAALAAEAAAEQQQQQRAAKTVRCLHCPASNTLQDHHHCLISA
jgi:hypothetical protein